MIRHDALNSYAEISKTGDEMLSQNGYPLMRNHGPLWSWYQIASEGPVKCTEQKLCYWAVQNQEARRMHHRWPCYEIRKFGYHATVFCQDDLGDRHAVYAEVFDHEGCESHAVWCPQKRNDQFGQASRISEA